MEIPDPSVTLAPGASKTIGIADLSAKFAVDGKIVTVNDAFVQASTPNGLNWRMESFQVYIAGIKTTRSTKPTLSFKARIMDSNGFVQYERKQGVYSNVEQARAFEKIGIAKTSYANGDSSGNYIFTVMFSSIVRKDEYLMITPPPSVTILPGQEDQCWGLRNLAKQLSCTISDSSIYVRLIPKDVLTKNSWQPGEEIELKISNIKNQISFALTDPF